MQQFTENHIDGTAIVTAAGAVDMMTAPTLQELMDAALARRPAGLILDMTEVDFLGSAGMQVLMIIHNRLTPATRFAVVADGPATGRPLKIAGVSDIVEVFSELSVALTNFSGASESTC